jgi:hypothetical protein
MRNYAASPICPDCQQIPKRYQFDSRWLCGCEGRTWPRLRGTRGDPREHGKLTEANFHMTTDSLGDTQYLGSSGQTVWLYENGTWRSDPDTKYRDFDEYVTAMAA